MMSVVIQRRHESAFFLDEVNIGDGVLLVLNHSIEVYPLLFGIHVGILHEDPNREATKITSVHATTD